MIADSELAQLNYPGMQPCSATTVEHACARCQDQPGALHMFCDTNESESCLVKAPAKHASESLLVVSELLCTSVQANTERHTRKETREMCSCWGYKQHWRPQHVEGKGYSHRWPHQTSSTAYQQQQAKRGHRRTQRRSGDRIWVTFAFHPVWAAHVAKAIKLFLNDENWNAMLSQGFEEHQKMIDKIKNTQITWYNHLPPHVFQFQKLSR